MCVVLVCVCASHLEMNSCGMYGSIPINMWNLVQLEYVPPPLCCPRDLVPVVCEWLLRARVCVCVYARALPMLQGVANGGQSAGGDTAQRC